MLAEEKRKARDAITQAHEAMQEAKRLQAEANAKYAAAEALLEKFGLADVPPQPTPPQKGAEALQRASSGYERIPIERSQLHHTGQQSGEPPTPCSRMGLFNEQPAAAGCDEAQPHGLQSVASSVGVQGAPLQAGQGAAPGRKYTKRDDRGVSRWVISFKYISSITRYISRI